MYLIVGLGNPGSKYDGTRHNVGFEVIDALSKEYGIDVNHKEHKGLVGKGIIEGKKVMLVKPQTFMNLSGECVIELAKYYDIDPKSELLVISDDVTLSTGNIRVRKKGSAGGHNGIKNIILHTGTEVFQRIKIGVGDKPKNYDLADWVLGHFSKEDQETMKESMQSVEGAVNCMLQGDPDKAMNDYNAKKK